MLPPGRARLLTNRSHRIGRNKNHRNRQTRLFGGIGGREAVGHYDLGIQAPKFLDLPGVELDLPLGKSLLDRDVLPLGVAELAKT
jgi:hypothetical protein